MEWLSNLPLGIMLVYQGLEKIKVGENGIYIFGIFFPWEEIEYYNWDLDKSNRLTLKVKKRRFFLFWQNKIKYEVNHHEQYFLDNLLKSNVVKQYN